jgi:glycosyltransferase involved in cell wall biosynthesis
VRKNILYLINTPHIKGGGEISLLNLLKKIDRKSYNPIAVCPSEGGMSSAIKDMNIPVEIVSMKRLRYFNLYSLVAGVRKLIQIINAQDIGIIHANGSRCMIYGGIAGRIKRIPVIWHVRIVERDNLLDRILSILADRIIVISNSVRNRFNWFNNKEKISVIYNGIDINDFVRYINVAQARKELSIAENDVVIGTVGQFIPMKGHGYFIEAAKIILEKVKNVKFIIGGGSQEDNSHEMELKNLVADYGIGDKLIFTGYRKDIKNIIALMDIFVFSAIGEGFGRVLIEAMALQKPVVAANSGGVPEIVVNGETGILVTEKDPLSMASAIIRLINERDAREKMGMAGKKRVEEMFTIERHTREIENLYSEVLKG